MKLRSNEESARGEGRAGAAAAHAVMTDTVMTNAVEHPPHYQANGIEVIDVIEAFDLGFRLGNAIKYLLRAGRKGDRLTDLKKARFYLDREIEKGDGGSP